MFSDEPSLPLLQLDNHLLRFYDECDKFQVEVNDNEETYAEARALETTQAWQEMESRVGGRAGVVCTSKWMAEKCICFVLNISCTNGRVSKTL